MPPVDIMFRLSAKLHHNWGYLLLFMRREAHKPTGPVVSTWHNKENSPKLTSTFFCVQFIHERQKPWGMDGRPKQVELPRPLERWTVDGERSQSRPHGRPTVTKPPSLSEPKTYFMERKAFIILIRRFLYVFINYKLYIACWTIKVTMQYFKHLFFIES